jgi:thioredoxin 1
MPEITAVTDDTFRADVLESDTPVLVDFQAPWSRACHLLIPTLEQLSDDYGDDLRIVTLNVDVNRNTTAVYDVLATPTMILFKDGRAAIRMTGAYGLRELHSQLSQVLPRGVRPPLVARPA